MSKAAMTKRANTIKSKLKPEDWEALPINLLSDSDFGKFERTSNERIESSSSSCMGWIVTSFFFVWISSNLLTLDYFTYFFPGLSLVLKLLFFIFIFVFSYVCVKLASVKLGKSYSVDGTVFDRRLGYYWKGDKNLTQPAHIEQSKRSCKLSDIVAVQVLNTRTNVGEDDEMPMCQLNLLLRNRKRVKIFDMPRGEKLIKEIGEEIAEFLGVPLMAKNYISVFDTKPVSSDLLESADMVNQIEASRTYEESYTKQRHFNTPFMVTLFGAACFVLMGGLIMYFQQYDPEQDMLYALRKIALQWFTVCAVSIIVLTVYNQRLLSGFLKQHPTIDGRAALEKLKPLLRTNMYSSLTLIVVQFIGLAMGAIALHTAFDRGWKTEVGIIIGIGLAVIIIQNWYGLTEQKVKQIPCDDNRLEQQLREILDCWITKAFPNF